MIPFNKPFLTGKETTYIEEAVRSGKISGNGMFTNKCQLFFENKYGFKKCLLTTSCTDALEMAAILCNIQPGDEVIVPSYTFVSTALAFVRQGAKIVFADSQSFHPNIDADKLNALISSRTKAIVPVHYAGVACDMDKIMEIAKKYGLFVIEDAAQSIDSFYTSPKTGKKKALGSIGNFGCFSFHETKNIISGEGGMLTINDTRYFQRSEVVWEKGTNRTEFCRGEVNKYEWIDIGSSFLPSELMAAFLWAQVENLEIIQTKRKQLWNLYYDGVKLFSKSGLFQLPYIPDYASNNAHIFYLVCNSSIIRSKLISILKMNNILSVSHYLSLHKSPFYLKNHDGRELINCDRYSDNLLRLPFYYELGIDEILRIIKVIEDAVKRKSLLSD